MPNSLSQWSLSFFILFFGCNNSGRTAQVSTPTLNVEVDTISTFSEVKKELTKSYSSKHYGLDTYLIDQPKMIVVHHTVIPTLEETIELFKQNHLAKNRTDIANYSSLNVGIHYVIDRDGSIYNLLPDSVMARHIIGFNHVSIGIENVARSSDELTVKQLTSNALLIQYLTAKYSSIEYLIGHDEYTQQELPHFKLFLELDSTYYPHDKPDPGPVFMKSLREKLKSEYALVFKK
ncbi:peptidoglycan recognition protein family protein [Ekhidna sp.]